MLRTVLCLVPGSFWWNNLNNWILVLVTSLPFYFLVCCNTIAPFFVCKTIIAEQIFKDLPLCQMLQHIDYFHFFLFLFQALSMCIFFFFKQFCVFSLCHHKLFLYDFNNGCIIFSWVDKYTIIYLGILLLFHIWEVLWILNNTTLNMFLCVAFPPFSSSFGET